MVIVEGKVQIHETIQLNWLLNEKVGWIKLYGTKEECAKWKLVLSLKREDLIYW